MPDFADIPAVHELTGEDDERKEQLFTRIVAMLIVLTTFAAAATAYLQASAEGVRDSTNGRATELASEAQSARTVSGEAAQTLVDRFDVAQQQRARAAAAEQQAFFGPAAQRPALAGERRRWAAVADETDGHTRAIAAAYGVPPITSGSALGPAGDRFFPQRYLAISRREAYRLGAERDAANQKGDAADSQVGRYAISLTVFAVAVFLFGYSLTPHARRHRTLFATTAAVFVAGGAIWVAVVAARAPTLPPDGAAAAFADGRVAYDSEQYATSVRDFSRALAAWPDYAQAHTLRARAEFSAGSPQLDVPLSLTTVGALAAAVADEERAMGLGAQDSGLLANAGYDLFALGLRRRDDGLIERGLGVSRQAAEARPTDPVPAFNAAVALLALGRLAEARRAYDDAVGRTVFSDTYRRVRRDDTAAYEFYLAEALTDLDSVAARRPALRPAIAQLKVRVIAPITRAAYGESLTGRVRQVAAAGGLVIAAGPAFTRLTILHPRSIGPDADVSAQWYYQAPGNLGWEILPDVSGAINNALRPDAGGALIDQEGFLAATGSCLSPGRYRVELNVNGRAVAAAVRTVAFPSLVAGRLRDLGLDICRPVSWSRIADPAPGLLDGYRSPDGSAGMVVVAVNRALVGAARPSPSLSRRILATALARFAGELPRGLAGGRATTQPFMGSATGVVRSYRYPGGMALAGAGAESRTGELLVAVAFGPPGAFSVEGGAVFGSLSREG